MSGRLKEGGRLALKLNHREQKWGAPSLHVPAPILVHTCARIFMEGNGNLIKKSRVNENENEYTGMEIFTLEGGN